MMNMDATGSLVKINIEGKPLEKLIEVVSSGIGTLYRPRKIRKEADAQAYAIKVLENAKATAGAETMMIEADTAERIGQRMLSQELRRQNNIDTVVEAAAAELKGEQVSDEPVDEDWATRFFGIVQDVSREEMKVLWSKILAKEIERPSSFSMRTLETLRNLSAKEAELFQKIAPYILHQQDYFIFNDSDVLKKHDIQYDDIAKLIECGILQSGTMVSKHYYAKTDEDSISGIINGEYVFIMNLPRGSKDVIIPVYILTMTGIELFSLIEPKVNLEYIKDLSHYIRKTNPNVIMQCAEIISVDDENIRYKKPAMDL